MMPRWVRLENRMPKEALAQAHSTLAVTMAAPQRATQSPQPVPNMSSQPSPSLYSRYLRPMTEKNGTYIASVTTQPQNSGLQERMCELVSRRVST